MIVTSNKPFSAWGEIFGDEVIVAAMIDRLVHHAEILGLKGDSYRLRDKDLGSPRLATERRRPLGFALRASLRGALSDSRGVKFQPAQRGQFSTGLDNRRGSAGSAAPMGSSTTTTIDARRGSRNPPRPYQMGPRIAQ